MIRGVDHIGVAVQDAEKSVLLYRDVLGFGVDVDRITPDGDYHIMILRLGDGRIELVQPLRPGTPVAKFIRSRGEGLHHIALRTDDIARELGSLDDKGVRLISKEWEQGMTAKRAFLHPSAACGVLVELIERR